MYWNAFATPEENEINNVWYLASAINYVKPNVYMPSMFIVVQGGKTRVDSNLEFKTQMIDSGSYAELVDVTGTYDHEEINKAIGRSDDDTITPLLTVFLNRDTQRPAAPQVLRIVSP